MELSITTVLVGINVLVSIWAFSSPAVFNTLLFNPSAVYYHKQWWRVPGHAFIHADWIHLFFNMFVLYQFGGLLESILSDQALFERLFPQIEFWGEGRGRFYYGLLYFGGMLAATLPGFQKHVDNPNYNSAGASGAVSAVVMGFILLLPTVPLYLFFIPIGIPAFILGLAYLGYEYYMSRKNHQTGIAHDAHLWGGLYGLLLLLILAPRFGLAFIGQVGAYIGL